MAFLISSDRRAATARILLAVVAVVVVAILLWPTRPAAGAQNWMAAWFERLHREGLPRWLGFNTIESAANVIMFLPLGLLTVLAWPRVPWWVPAIGWLLFSAAAEITQASLEPDRVGDWRDVAANSSGALIGTVLASRWINHRSAASSEQG